MNTETSPKLYSIIEIQQWLLDWLSKELELDATPADVQEPFINFGLSSRQAVILAGELEDWLGITLEPSLAWEYPTIQQLSEYLAQQVTQTS